jgi:hypothetical protein
MKVLSFLHPSVQMVMGKKINILVILKMGNGQILKTLDHLLILIKMNMGLILVLIKNITFSADHLVGDQMQLLIFIG